SPDPGVPPMKRIVMWTVVVAVVLGGCAVWMWWQDGEDEQGESRAGGFFRRSRTAKAVQVEVVSPLKQPFERRAVLPGSVIAYESVDLYAEASGYLKKLKVDLGDRVKEDDLLAEIDVPDVRKQKEKAQAQKALAEARLIQVGKAVKRAEADRRVARATVPLAEAQLSASKATARYRAKQHARILDLFKSRSVEERLVDESEERKEAAASAERAAVLAVETAEAQQDAADAKVEQAKADVAEAEANVAIAEAELGRMDVLLSFARITAPFPGVVTKRNVFPGAFIRSAKEGGLVPLLSLDRTDKLRVVAQIPDRDVPFADIGDKATVEIDSLGGRKFEGTIARTQGSEDAQTRTMRIEIDLDNKAGKLRPGMFGKVTIQLESAAVALTLPSACLVGEARDGKASVWVVRDGKAKLVPITIGSENGLLVEVVGGVTEKDRVVRRHNGTLADGAAVHVPEAVAGL
ncbi:MAG: efflux RND transporter periplasmic adaptor subunit, partial [Gemmataceae bacterium]|nr:efflux RND transporter periplasmic adaptor subunit [Gemmataceae bacterium]